MQDYCQWDSESVRAQEEDGCEKKSESIPLPSHTPIQPDLEHQEPDVMTVRCFSGQTIACQVLCRKFDSDLE